MSNRTSTKYLTRLMIIAGILIGLQWAAAAQGNSITPAYGVSPETKALLEKVQQAYRQPAYLGFHVFYQYANEAQPDHPVDTLSGEVEMDKARSRTILGETETLVTERYALQILPEDKVIYLSKPTRPTMIDPVGALDSVWTQLQSLHTEISKDGPMEKFSIFFPPGGAYTRIMMTIDTQSGYLSEITYDVYTAGFVDRDQLDRPGHAGPYQAKGQVTVRFTHYRHGTFGETAFDTGNYFTRVGDQFEPAGQYKDYHIFLASSHY